MKCLCVILVIIVSVLSQGPSIEKLTISSSRIRGYTGPSVESHRGFISLDNDYQANINYWLFPNAAPSSPLILWFNGGPGCSSMVGVFLEHGPFRYSSPNPGINVQENPYSWHKTAHMLYIDNPCGAGFSHGNDSSKYPVTATTAMADIYKALKIFFSDEGYPEYKNCDFYVMGESYGGKFSIALADIIDREKSDIKLKGIALGNAWVHPDIHQRVYPEYGYSFGLLNYHNFVQTKSGFNQCHKLIMQNEYRKADNEQCTPNWQIVLHSGGGFNHYDVRRLGEYDFLTSVSTYIKSIAEYIGITPGVPFHLCSNSLFDEFLDDFQKNYIDILPRLLEKYKVLVYNGQFDIRCSVLGTNEWIRLLNWDGKNTFNFMHQEQYRIRNETKGLFKQHKNLFQSIVYGAGHLAPYDQPEVTYDMIKRFVHESSLCSATPTGQCKPVPCPSNCSNRGACQNGVCKCYSGYEGDNCSLVKKNLQMRRKQTYNGYIFGNDINTYQFNVDPSLARSNFDIHITISKTKPFGKLHMYVSGGHQFIQPDITYPSVFAKSFKYQSLEDTDSRTMYINELSGANNTHVTLVVLNTADIEAEYSIQIISDKSGKKADTQLIFSIALFSLCTLVVIALGIAAIVQFYYDTEYYASIKNYRTEANTFDEDEEILN